MQSDNKKDDNAINEKVFDYTLYSDYLKQKLCVFLETIQGNKHLVYDQEVINIINVAIRGGELKNRCGIINFTLLQNFDKFSKDCKQVLFFLQPKVAQMKKLESIIKSMEGRADTNINKYLIFWPKMTTICKEALEKLGILGDFYQIRDFSFDLVPMDSDILSLEMNFAFRDLYLDNDYLIYSQVAESLQRIQMVYGKFQNIFIKGDGAKIVYDIVTSEQIDEQKGSSNTQNGEIDTLILLDRSVDLLTPLLNQFIYLGRLDQMYQIQSNIFSIEELKIKQTLSSNNEVFRAIRDELQWNATQIIEGELKDYTDIQNTQLDKQKNVEFLEQITKRWKRAQEYKQFNIDSLKIVEQMDIELKSFQFYKDINTEQEIIQGNRSEVSYEYISALMPFNVPIERIFKLAALQSQVDRGLNKKTYEELRNDIHQAYGFRAVLSLQNLTKAGIIKKQDGQKSQWQKIKDQLNLIDESTDLRNYKDISYIYQGYAPLLGRLAQFAMKNSSWKQIQDALKLLPGFTSYSDTHKKNKEKEVVLIYVIGGLTYSEIAAFRYLGKQLNKEVIIATTNLINWKKLIKSLLYEQDPPLGVVNPKIQ